MVRKKTKLVKWPFCSVYGPIADITKFLDFRETFAAMRLSRTFLMSADSRLKSWWIASEKSKDPVSRFYDFCIGVDEEEESPFLHMVDIGCFATIASELMEFACEKGHARLLRKLIETAPPISNDYRSKLTAIACQSGSRDIVEFLHGSMSFSPCCSYVKWAASACRNNRASVLDYFMGLAQGQLLCCNSLLHTASTNGCTRVVHRLLKDPSARASSKENRALLAACEGGHSSIAKMLISHGTFAPVNMERCLREALRTSDEIVESIMFCEGIAFDFDLAPVMRWACKRSNLEVARLVAEADSSERMVEAYLTMACSAGCVPIAKLLMDRYEADPSKKNSRAMICACKSGSASMVELLLRDGRADPSRNNSEAIIMACKMEDHEVLELLLRDGRADPSVDNNSAIAMAAGRGSVRIVRSLLNDARVDPSDCSSAALQLASGLGNYEIVRMLLEDGRADPSANSNFSIITAAMLGHLRVVGLLMSDDRVDPSAKRNSAVEKAYRNGHEEVVHLLMAHPTVNQKFTSPGRFDDAF